MKNIWKRLFYKVCPSVFYSRGRSSNIDVIRYINTDNDFIIPKDLLEYLNIIHPQKWFDDEAEALFFATYDYITKVRKCKVVTTRCYDNEWVVIKISSDKKVFRYMTLVEFGNAYNLIATYKMFVRP